MNDLRQKMATICSVPAGRIEYDGNFQLYCCRCGCGMKLSRYFLENACPREKVEAHQLHRILTSRKGVSRAK